MQETFMLETETNTLECTIVSTVFSNIYQKNYVIYTDESKDETGELNYFISSFSNDLKDLELKDVEDEKEIEEVLKLLGEQNDE